METQAVRMIKQMLLLTKSGKLRWSKSSDDCDKFEAAVSGQAFHVEFIYLARTDEVGSDRTVARFCAFNLMFDYSIGTEGFDLLCEMLSTSDQEWVESRERGRVRFERGMRFLHDLVQTP